MPRAQRPPARKSSRRKPAARRVLVIDVGGNKVKLHLSTERKARRFPSGPELTPAAMIEELKRTCRDWRYDVVTLGYPGRVGPEGPRDDPPNLGTGWVGFDFETALGSPVRVVNDAVLQALGSYDGGRMLFLGFGTGVGAALILNNAVIALELSNLPGTRKRTLGELLGDEGLERWGKRAWRRHVTRIVEPLRAAFGVDYVVLGGGNAKVLEDLPRGARRGNNRAVLLGGVRVWEGANPETRSRSRRTSPGARPRDVIFL